MTIEGYVGAEPQMMTSPSGHRRAHFNVATSESWRDKQTKEIREKVSWHKIEVQGRCVPRGRMC